MFRVVQVKTGDFVKGDAFIELRIGRTRQDIDLMAEFFQSPAQVLDINPLPPQVGFPGRSSGRS